MTRYALHLGTPTYYRIYYIANGFDVYGNYKNNYIIIFVTIELYEPSFYENFI